MTDRDFIQRYMYDIKQSVSAGHWKDGTSIRSMLATMDDWQDIIHFDSALIENAVVISDMHFGHTNIIKYSGRPFESLFEMDATIRANIRNAVSHKSHLIVVGDCSMYEGIESTRDFLYSLPCETYLVFGNHDLHSRGGVRAEGFDYVAPMMYMEGEPNLVFTHYPLMFGNMTNTFNVHGHLHTNPSPSNRHVNMAVEQLGYKPAKLSSVYNLARREMKNKTITDAQELTCDRFAGG